MRPSKQESQCLDGPGLYSCRDVENYTKLNRIEEGSYGVVYRAKDNATGTIYALKRFKLEKEMNGFPVTSLREIHMLKLLNHPNIVQIREVVTTSDLTKVFMVMEYMEHDLKSLMEAMAAPFMLSEAKTLFHQLLSAINCMHQNWIIHRDLKTSNLLMNNRGQIKIADFGLARQFGSPLGEMTQCVVTLWYRSPELLFGAKEYTTGVDMWSAGCIFGELLTKKPLFPGNGDIEQINTILKLLGTPNDDIWPGFSNLPHSNLLKFKLQPYNKLASHFSYLSQNAQDLLTRLLIYDPEQRISAKEALNHSFFT